MTSPSRSARRLGRLALSLGALVVALGIPRAGSASDAIASVTLLAAGSLRGALTRIAEEFTRRGGPRVDPTFGPSGLLRERIEREGIGGLFASASLQHPDMLRAAGRAGPPVIFARNEMVLVAAPGNPAGITPENWIERLADPQVKVGTSTPGADPAGDYTWALFRRVDRDRPGFLATMDRKALKLVGGSLAPSTAGRSPYAAVLDDRKADVLITYRTNAVALRDGERRPVAIVPIPERYAVRADYALTLLSPADAGAAALAFYILSPAGQAILAAEGFVPVALPLESPE